MVRRLALLRAHVGGCARMRFRCAEARAHTRASRQLRQSKIREFSSALRIEEDIARLEVAVHGIERVQRRQTLGNLGCPAQHLGYWQRGPRTARCLQALAQTAAGRVFHHQDERLSILLEIMHLDDGGMPLELCAQFSLQLEALAAALEIAAAHAGRVATQHFECARGLQLQMQGAVDLAKGARANQALDAVFGEQFSIECVGHRRSSDSWQKVMAKYQGIHHQYRS